MPENAEIPAVYHPWKEQYNPIVTREKFVKSMTKDPYTRMKRLMCHAVENVTTETECCPILIAPENVKSKAVNVQIAPKRSSKIFLMLDIIMCIPLPKNYFSNQYCSLCETNRTHAI